MATIHRAKIAQKVWISKKEIAIDVKSLQDLQAVFAGRLNIIHRQERVIIAFHPDDERRLDEIMSRGGLQLFEKRCVYM